MPTTKHLALKGRPKRMKHSLLAKVQIETFNLNQYNCPDHSAHDHSPALDSGFRRNDVSYHAVFKSIMPAKAGAFRYPGLFLDLLSNYNFTRFPTSQQKADG